MSLAPGAWEKIAENPTLMPQAVPQEIRRMATYEMHARGIHYLMIYDTNYGAEDFAEDPEAWGLKLIGHAEECAPVSDHLVMRLYLGIDGGQSSTTALIGDETGRVLGVGTRGTVQSRGGGRRPAEIHRGDDGAACARPRRRRA